MPPGNSVDLSTLSDADLQAVAAGDMSKVSDDGLKAISGGQAPAPASDAGGRTAKTFIGVPYNPQREEMLRQQLATGGWGTGVPKLADQLGGQLADSGLPAIGAVVHTLPDALQMAIGGNVTGAAKPLAEAGAKAIMQSAIKPTAQHLLSGDAARGIQTMLDEGINATPAGMVKLRSMVGDLHKQVESLIENSKERVSTSGIPAMVNRAWNKFKYSTINPAANASEIKNAVEDYLSTVKRLDPMSEYGQIPVQLAQKIKRANQTQLADEFGSLSAPYYEAQKDLTRGIRTGIEAVHPEVGALNSKMEELLNAMSVSEKHALMALNKNVGGLASLAENPKAAAAFMADRSAAFKSVLARMLYSVRGGLTKGAGAVGVGSYNAMTPEPPN